MRSHSERTTEKSEDVLATIFERAKKAHATIGLADTEDERVTKAVEIIQNESLAKPVLIKADFFHSLPLQEQEVLLRTVQEVRAARGKPISDDEARGWLSTDTKYVAAAMVKAGKLDGYVAGNISSTENTLRPALQIIGAPDGYASSFFIMLFPDDRPLFFADCGFNYDPNSEELAKIAVDTAHTVQELGIEPRIAFLSFSTAGSSAHEHVRKVQTAIAKARELAPDLAISEHELQLDAALDKSVAERKVRGSGVAGNANVLIFPDLDSGNMAYKMANLLGVRAIGPIMQGLSAPANDLSRGCSVQDIVDVVAVTAMQAGALKNKRES